jgi:hypothetical protein
MSCSGFRHFFVYFAPKWGIGITMQVRIEKDIRKPLKASAKKNARSVPKEASRLIREKLAQEVDLTGPDKATAVDASSCTS